MSSIEPRGNSDTNAQPLPAVATSAIDTGRRWWKAHHSRAAVVAASALPFLLVLAAWQTFGAVDGPRSIFLPPPTKVGGAFLELFSEQDFYVDIGWSVYRVTVAFLLAVLVAVPIGILAGRFE